MSLPRNLGWGAVPGGAVLLLDVDQEVRVVVATDDGGEGVVHSSGYDPETRAQVLGACRRVFRQLLADGDHGVCAG